MLILNILHCMIRKAQSKLNHECHNKLHYGTTTLIMWMKTNCLKIKFTFCLKLEIFLILMLNAH
ncbi:hypothetical protein XSR1_320032 [Xenorhabdus szentirmaii DSM 16338]|uniref:Uncharacterized protein n=1 Tax=Xenorhabdus szentirmaii DSM 16338 TaxID=1427518 RepID=W1J0F9_9GAMM|nr:hypothetical protein XSR1_320032 [Xenorhabdus szentirmaii DSM 16338]